MADLPGPDSPDNNPNVAGPKSGAGQPVPDPSAFSFTARPGNDRSAEDIIKDYWAEKRQRAGTEKGLNKIADLEQKIERFVDNNRVSEESGADYERIFSRVLWYKDEIKSGNVKENDFSGLRLFGLDIAKIESIFHPMADLAQGYIREAGAPDRRAEIANEYSFRKELVNEAVGSFCREYNLQRDPNFEGSVVSSFFKNLNATHADDGELLRGLLTHNLTQALESKLTAVLSSTKKTSQDSDRQLSSEGVLLSYSTLAECRSLGTLLPDFQKVVAINKSMASGGTGFIFCCPDYSRRQLSDGSFEYSMDGLGTGTGLTAERALPVVQELLSRALDMSNRGLLQSSLNLRIGVADFESTPDNATLTGCGTVAEFDKRLGRSVDSIAAQILRQAAPGIECGYSMKRYGADPIHSVIVDAYNRKTDEPIATIVIGRVTNSFLGVVPTEAGVETLSKYRGLETFREMVEEKREVLRTLATESPQFYKKLDLLLMLRLDLMLKWQSPDAPDYLKELASKVPVDNKAEVLIDLQQAHQRRNLGDNDPYTHSKAEALDYLRTKIALQGAEYASMHDLIGSVNNSYQLVADAQNMWQVFGKKSIPILGIRGGYKGAEVVDLS